jgi:hypothetical protein
MRLGGGHGGNDVRSGGGSGTGQVLYVRAANGNGRSGDTGLLLGIRAARPLRLGGGHGGNDGRSSEGSGTGQVLGIRAAGGNGLSQP